MELQVYYQPMVDLGSGKISCFEALLRWHHPTKKNISPVEFIPIAEDTGLIIPLGYWILQTAMVQTRIWQTKFDDYPNLNISVNLSGKQVHDANLVAKVEQMLQQTGLNPQSLKLEVTESVLMENFDSALLIFNQLKSLGIGLAIDDFGTGYSSLGRLQSFPVDAIKIDRCFIQNINKSNEDLELVKGIIALAGNLGIKIVVEGIETAAQLEILRELSVSEGQGYYFAKALDSHSAETLLDSSSRW